MFILFLIQGCVGNFQRWRHTLDFTFKRVLMKGIQFVFWTLFDNICYYVHNTWQLDWWMRRPRYQLSIKAILVSRRCYDEIVLTRSHWPPPNISRDQRENHFLDCWLPNIFTRGGIFSLWDVSCSDDDWSSVHRESKQQTKVLLSLHSVAPGSLI